MVHILRRFFSEIPNKIRFIISKKLRMIASENLDMTTKNLDMITKNLDITKEKADYDLKQIGA